MVLGIAQRLGELNGKNLGAIVLPMIVFNKHCMVYNKKQSNIPSHLFVLMKTPKLIPCAHS